jgi:uncharacterized repeat protein (TIGR03803 family)
MACTQIGQAQVAPPLTTLHSFNVTDGIMFEPNIPWSGYSVLGAALIQARDGNLYGTTPYGGTAGYSGDGTVFKITAAGQFTSLYSFSNFLNGYEPNGVVQGRDGNLYGTTVEGGDSPFSLNGTIFKLTLSGTLTTLYNCDGNLGQPGGVWPYAALTLARDGSLYGSTGFGAGGFGPIGDGYGSLFKLHPDGTHFSTLYAFTGGADGANMWAPLIQGKDGNLYGTCYGYAANVNGSVSLSGSVFRMTPSGKLTVLHTFGSDDGAWPFGALVQPADGNFYGTTSSGGANNNGTIFKVTSSGVYTTLYSFSASGVTDGANPYAGLIVGKDGVLYGTAANGGATGWGTVFRFIPATGSLTTLYSFSDDSGGGNLDGADPIAPLLQGKDGNLYGTTSYGGPDDVGAVFKLTMTPVISSFSPAKGKAGTSITLTGANFTEATNVQFGGTYVGFKILSDTSLTFTVPAGAKSGKITVYNPFGAGASKTAFRVLP